MNTGNVGMNGELKIVRVPDGSGWVSMGEGRYVGAWGSCSSSPDGQHHYYTTDCIQSTERKECRWCGDWMYD